MKSLGAPARELDTSGDRKQYLVGTHRSRPPAETVAQIAPLMAKAGITRVANLTGLDRIGIPVVSVVRPNARSLSVSQGKGLDLAAAKASGIMEALESYHAENVDLPLCLASEHDQAQRAEIAPLASLPRLRGTVPDRFQPILWIEGRDLMSGRAIWVPYEIVHTNYTLPRTAESACLVASSNGLASGNTLGEAIVHAVAEVVERDAVTLWELLPENEIAARRMDLATVAPPACRSLLVQLRAAGMVTAVWDITSDTGLPAFYCLIVDGHRRDGHSGAGAGCHTSADVAMARAITEAVQVRCNYIAGARDDLLPHEYSAANRDEKRQRAERLMTLTSPTRRDFSEIAAWQNGSAGEDIETMLTKLSDAGLDRVVCVDLSRPDFGVAVVRVVIPGLEGPDDHPDFAPGARAMAMMERRT